MDEPGTVRGATLADRLARWRWPLVVLALGVLALLAYRLTLQSAGHAARGAGEIVRNVGQGIATLGRDFRSGTITTTFISSLPQIEGAGSGRLELVKVEVVEILSISDERRILWGRLSLGETVSEIRVPTTYRYHLRLDDPWELEVADQTCIVRAPRIRASLPPAIDTAGMTTRSENGWLRFNADQQLDELQRGLTATLSEYALDERHIALVRETGRRTVAEFVRGWLLREDHWREDRFRAVIVLFEGETFDDLYGPTLRLEQPR